METQGWEGVVDALEASPAAAHLHLHARPEIALLLAGVRAPLDMTQRTHVMALLDASLDWLYLIQAASFHRVLAALAHTLVYTCPERVPPPLLPFLHAEWQAAAQRAQRLTDDLLTLLALLADQGIPAIPFKGPVLAASAYQPPARRAFEDLDLLVQPRDVVRAVGILRTQGYQLVYHAPPPQAAYLRRLRGAREAAYLRSRWEHHLIRADGRVTVDLHQGIAQRFFSFPLEATGVWTRLVSVTVAGTPISTLSAEDTLLLLCAHGAKDRWRQLYHICDIGALLATHPSLDWARVLALARSLGGMRMLGLGLRLAQDLLGSTVPGAVVRRLQADPAVSRLSARVYAQLFPPPDCLRARASQPDPRQVDGPPRLTAVDVRYHLSVRERRRDRVRYGLHLGLMPTVADWMVLPLPPAFGALYYLLRPLRLVARQSVGRFAQR